MAADTDPSAGPPHPPEDRRQSPSRDPLIEPTDIAALAHAAKTAITSALGALQLVADDPLTADQTEHLGLAHSALLDLTRQVEELAGMETASAADHALPSPTPQSPEADQGRRHAAPGLALLVEDNLINQQIAQAMLEKVGVKVELAGNGQQALEALDRGRFALILMDIGMPVMDGLEATRRLRQREALGGLPRTPVIALTAHTTATDRQACIDAGMDDFLPKPFNRAALEQIVERWA